MAVTVIKAERVVKTALGLLERSLTLPRLVWRDAAGDFRGAKGDTITIRLPSYFKARKRALRAGTPRTKDALFERTIDVSLTDDIYGVIPITDEELTLDIENFNEQILAPVLNGVARSLEDEIVTEITGATYAHEVELDPADPYLGMIDARAHLNNAYVPFDSRFCIVGTAIENAMLKSERLSKFDQSGDSSALRSATIGRMAGNEVITIPALPPDEGYVFHKTAYVLNTRAPFVPRGVAWGASQAWEGFAMRVAQQVDPDELVDNFHADAWVGTNHVTDQGTLTNGKFEPAVTPDVTDPITDALFVRAVKLTLGSA